VTPDRINAKDAKGAKLRSQMVFGRLMHRGRATAPSVHQTAENHLILSLAPLASLALIPLGLGAG